MHDSDAGISPHQDSRTNQYFFWSSSATDLTSENSSLLSRAPTPSNDLEAFGKVSSNASDSSFRASGNPFSASAAAYGTFFGRSKVSSDDDDVEAGTRRHLLPCDDVEEPAVPSHLHPSLQALLLSASCIGVISMACLVHPPATSFEAMTSTVAGNAAVGFCFFFVSEIAAQVPPTTQECRIDLGEQVSSHGICTNFPKFRFFCRENVHL
jgi:hypothetical protein